MLYIIPTPIGNLEDLTFRSLRILKEVDLILVESYRISKRLLNFYNIKTNVNKYHIHNESKMIPYIINEIKQGKKLALISNAGTPSISDPGYLIIKHCINSSISIECLPGPTAIIPSLVISGFPINEFLFIGFLPKKKRKIKLEKLSKEKKTIVIYESPHRLLKTLNDIKNYFGINIHVAICKEISKLFQKILRGSIKEILIYYNNNNQKILGEYTIVINNKNIV
ncbi:16S rRNA (cytidine(1402)-2'-O)-methyltransferase [Blattabacterium cuenoti]|uniref:16S rRNA (cytidine(1402)-2'-O)-methyltransferase n=1 Tax=Blattabacterium cuenoti TaxID=1653831 RepID=UPI00163C2F39|nr:16S rRNA (cytidine(1402)-2'-O)-methyltransferase [Blattabacterium cuenoti]